ncbi:nucleotide-binding universal stress UspA family protein [Rhodococcus wratislaviensis]|uniref:Universal stress protein n=3 Tax=Rhodococcus TaxID=1827 RepID=A0AB38FHP6_RHOWR|nr:MULTISPECIES: universal stress protein [Rhodococcus]AII08926.1 universal stress protein [Rhodococcus opacus]REE75967.1 nucleotide-binding universal stress UspA family protein [Rhodococcus wratislaviensis]WAM13134.1 universal stress protein [Rhodococcus sp. JS3073]SPZ40991.1 universal stress protein [Rhodococcus wratislaviensis]GAF44780.1 putative Usp family protein [Rhodococcus wratislaviensis NBRC 100605]
MTGIKPIVVGVDGSESASAAVAWAARAAAALSLPLHIVTVVHIPAFYYTEPYLAESFKEELEDTAKSRLGSARVHAKQTVDEALDITTEQHEGKVSQTLIELSANAHMVVLGSRGHGEFTGLLVGSTTSAVAAHGHCPLVVVRGRTMDGQPPTEGPIVVGVDGSESSKAAVEVAFEQAAARGASLVAVNVWSDVSVQPSLGASPEDPLWSSIQTGEEVVLSERLAGYQERYPDVTVERVVARDRPVRVLSEFAEKAQLIVVGSRGRGGFKGMLLGSTSNALLHTADCPVMIVRPES